jgi:hypothetical protein
MKMHKGSCLCGAVKYEIEGDLGPVMLCHCSKCRKGNGSAFNTASLVNTADFRLLSGNDHLTEFETGPGIWRIFCKTCGSPLYSRRSAMPEAIRIRVGTLDTPVPGKVSGHIYVGSKAEWFDILDDAPQFAERP